MALPTLTDDQRKNALEKATEVRRVRAEFKKKIASRELNANDALNQALGEEILSKLRVSDFLRALPGYGKVKATETQEKLGIATTRRLRGLGSVQISNLRALCSRVDNTLSR